MYIKDKKTFENPFGISKVQDELNPFSKPFILGIVPSGNIRSLNGYLSKIVDLLGLKNSNSINSGLGIEKAPFSLLISENNDNEAEKILNLIPENDFINAKKIIRNVNILSYCAGHEKTLKIINSIYDGLIEKGYSRQETEEILSQIAILQIVDNLYYNGNFIKFPYITSITFHNLHDSENYSWIQNPKSDWFHEGLFSKMGYLMREDNNLVMLYDSFGEGSLRETNNEHTFINDYIKAPVMNTLISIGLINAISSSINQEEININSLRENMEYILKKTFLYEKGCKPLNQFAKEDLEAFNQYLYTLIIEYSKNKFKVQEYDKKKFEIEKQRIKLIKNVAKMGLDFSYLELQNIIDEIVNYYQNYDKNDICEIGGNFILNLPVEKIIADKLQELLKKLSNLIEKMKEIEISSDISKETYNEFEIYKQSILKNILNPTILEIMEEYNCNLFDIDENIVSKNRK